MSDRNEADPLLQHSAAPQGVQLYGDMACPTSNRAAPAVMWTSVCSLQPSSSSEETCRATKSKTRCPAPPPAAAAPLLRSRTSAAPPPPAPQPAEALGPRSPGAAPPRPQMAVAMAG